MLLAVHESELSTKIITNILTVVGLTAQPIRD